MSIRAWNGERFSDEVVWDAINNEKITDLRVDEEVKETIRWFAREAGVHSIEDITLALALYPVHNPEETEQFLQAWNDKRNDGPFEELVETCGYPIFRDQILAVMEKRLDISFNKACELASGMAKKTTKARDELYRHIRVPKKVLDDLWKYSGSVKDRRWLRHYATLIYEAVWLLQNGSREAFAEHPIVIGGTAEERKDDNR